MRGCHGGAQVIDRFIWELDTRRASDDPGPDDEETTAQHKDI